MGLLGHGIDIYLAKASKYKQTDLKKGCTNLHAKMGRGECPLSLNPAGHLAFSVFLSFPLWWACDGIWSWTWFAGPWWLMTLSTLVGWHFHTLFRESLFITLFLTWYLFFFSYWFIGDLAYPGWVSSSDAFIANTSSQPVAYFFHSLNNEQKFFTFFFHAEMTFSQDNYLKRQSSLNYGMSFVIRVFLNFSWLCFLVAEWNRA